MLIIGLSCLTLDYLGAVETVDYCVLVIIKKYIIMDVNEFREFGRAAIDFVADYLENIRDRCAINNQSLLIRSSQCLL